MLTPAAAQRIAAAVVVASECGTMDCTVCAGGGSSVGRDPVEDRISAKELRRRWGIVVILDVELRRDVDCPRTSEEDPGVEGVDDPAEVGLVVCGGVSTIRDELVETSDKARGKAVLCEVIEGNAGPVLPDGEIENRRESDERSGDELAKEGD